MKSKTTLSLVSKLHQMAGALAGEIMRGVCFEICGPVLQADLIHFQMEGTAMRVLHAAQLIARPRLLEPIYQIQIELFDKYFGGICDVYSVKMFIVLYLQYIQLKRMKETSHNKAAEPKAYN